VAVIGVEFEWESGRYFELVEERVGVASVESKK